MKKLVIVIFLLVTVLIELQGQIPGPPVISTIIQPTCSISTGSVTLSNLPAVSWTINPGNIAGTGTETSITITGLNPGSYNYTVTTTGGTSDPPTVVVINIQPLPPPSPTASTTIQPTCSAPTGTIVVTAPLGAYEYNIDGGAYQAATAFTGVEAGAHPILVRSTTDNTCISTQTSVTVNAQPSAPAAATVSVTQPTCSSSTGTIEVTAPLGEYHYNIDGGAYQAATTFAGVAAGTHSILVRSTVDNACISSSTSVTIITQPSAPDVATFSITQPSCASSTGTVVVSAPIGAYQYNIDGGTYQASTTFSAVAAGSHNILVRNTTDNTCVSSPASLTINTQPSPPPSPTASATIQPTCSVPTGTIVITAPLGAYQYNIDGGAYQAATTFAGVAAGPHTILARSTSDNTCISTSTSVTVNAQPSPPPTPTASTTIQPTCSAPTGTIVVTAPLGAYQYNIDGGAYQAATTFAGVEAGTHTILVRSTTDNSCISTPRSVTVNAQPSAPAAATVSVTQPTCSSSTGTIVVSAPIGAYQYNIDGGTYQASTTFSAVAAGSHNILVRSTADNACISSSTSVTISSQPSVPAAATVSITQPTCASSTGTIVVSAPIGAYQYNIDGGTYQASTTFSSVTAGSHNILVRRTADHTCISSSASATINAQPATPAAPAIGIITHPTCDVGTGSIILNGLPSSGTWTITRTPGSITNVGTGISSTISGLETGKYNFTVTNSSDCTSASSDDAVINSGPLTPAAPAVGTITQPTCAAATGSVVLNGLPSSGTWALTRTPGAVTATGTGTSTTVPGLAANTYTFTVALEGGCTSSESGNVVINAQPITPTAPVAGTITQPTCTVATGGVVLNGLPATGTWTLTRSQGGVTTTGSGTSSAISGLAAGTYTYIVTNASGCISPASANIVINLQPSTPTAPTLGTITHPTCSLATGSVVLNGLPATGTWTLTRTPDGTVSTGTGINLTISSIPAGSYTFTVTNAVGCTSTPSANAVINARPPTPTAPVIGTITQPTLSVATGSVVLSGLPASGTWTLTRTPEGTITAGTGSSTTITGLNPGTYTFTVTNSSGCTSLASAAVGLFTLKLYGPDQNILHPNDIIKIDNPDAGSISISVESNTDWAVSENSLWLKAVKESGSSKITVTYLENISAKDKVAAIRVSYTSNPDFVVNIQQKARVSQLNNSKFENVKIYPNPANDIVYLNFGKVEFEKMLISITNIQGFTISTKQYKDITSGQIIGLIVTELPVGQYLINIGDGVQSKSFHLIKY